MIPQTELIRRLRAYRLDHMNAPDRKDVRIGIIVAIGDAILIAKQLEKDTQERLKQNPHMASGIIRWVARCVKQKGDLNGKI